MFKWNSINIFFVFVLSLCLFAMDKWIECSRDISRLTAIHNGDFDHPDLKSKLRERSKISAIAEGKIASLSRALDRENPREIKYTIIYVTDSDPQQLIDVKAMLEKKGLMSRQMTQEESPKQRREIMRLFKDKIFIEIIFYAFCGLSTN